MKTKEEIAEKQERIIENQEKIIDLLQTLEHTVQLANRIEQALALKKQGYIDAIQDRVKTERSSEGRD
tara:strand:+ start:168 stop:371 length:204 start_codon:yes stop_codon:yes gene_type:complete